MTVPVEPLPPSTVDGESVSPDTAGVAAAGGVTFNVRLDELAPYAAETETCVELLTDLLMMNAKLLLVVPVCTIMVCGRL